MLQAFRTIDIGVELKDGQTVTISVPFTVELLERVEETIWKASERPWYRLRPKDESVVRAFEEFCKPYLPQDFPYQKAQPTFCALFFSGVRDELNRSIADCMKSTTSTGE